MAQRIWSNGIDFMYHVIIKNRFNRHQIKHQLFVIQQCQWLIYQRHFCLGVHFERSSTDGRQNSIYFQKLVRQKICRNIQNYWNSKKLKIQICQKPVMIIQWWRLVSTLHFIFRDGTAENTTSAVLSIPKVGCVFPIVVLSIPIHEDFGRNDHQEDATHFIF